MTMRACSAGLTWHKDLENRILNQKIVLWRKKIVFWSQKIVFCNYKNRILELGAARGVVATSGT